MNENKRKALMEFIENGRIMVSINMYKEKNISLGKAAEIAGVCLSDMMDLLTKFGINSNVTINDFKESFKHKKKLKTVHN